jgi:hypothetical protein
MGFVNGPVFALYERLPEGSAVERMVSLRMQGATEVTRVMGDIYQHDPRAGL